MHLVTPVSRTNHSARVLHRHTTYLREDAAILVLAEEVYRCETAVAVYVRLHRKEEDFERLCLLRGVKRYPRSDSLAARSRLLKLHAVPYLADLPPAQVLRSLCRRNRRGPAARRRPSPAGGRPGQQPATETKAAYDASLRLLFAMPEPALFDFFERFAFGLGHVDDHE